MFNTRLRKMAVIAGLGVAFFLPATHALAATPPSGSGDWIATPTGPEPPGTGITVPPVVTIPLPGGDPQPCAPGAKPCGPGDKTPDPGCRLPACDPGKQPHDPGHPGDDGGEQPHDGKKGDPRPPTVDQPVHARPTFTG